MSRGREDARLTLSRASSFLAGRAVRAQLLSDEDAVARYTRYTANCLRELDRFLCLLLDELTPPDGPPRRNAANRMTELAMLGRAPVDTSPVRLRALGRSTACLQHCAGWVRRPDEAAGGWMTAGWPDDRGDDLRRYPLGSRLRPGTADLADVGTFYGRLAEAVG